MSPLDWDFSGHMAKHSGLPDLWGVVQEDIYDMSPLDWDFSGHMAKHSGLSDCWGCSSESYEST
jgi:hypothetical protein